MNNANLIGSDITKKQKAVINQRKYRERLKNGTPGKEGTTTTYETYKKSNAEYMRKYRSEKKIATIKAYAETNPEPQTKTEEKIAKVQKQISITEQRRSGRESKQVDMSIQVKRTIVKQNIYKQVVYLNGKRVYQKTPQRFKNRMLVLMTNQPVVKWLKK